MLTSTEGGQNPTVRRKIWRPISSCIERGTEPFGLQFVYHEEGFMMRLWSLLIVMVCVLAVAGCSPVR